MAIKCPRCCYVYIPEFTMESTLILGAIKAVILVILVACLTLFEVYLDERVFDSGSKITFATLLIVIIFNITVVFLSLIYVPYQWHITPFWYSATITVIYVALLIFFSLEGLVFDRISNVDDPAFDGWTAVHTICGVWLGFVMPFVPMCYVVSVWEVLEADWTEGLGDGESVSNHVVDVVVAVVGWFFTVLLSMYVFPRLCEQSTLNCMGKRDKSKSSCLIRWAQPFHRIPWISSRAASSNSLYWETDWESDQVGTEQSHQNTEMQSTV